MEKKKPIILSVIALLALVALVVGATFAYFQAQVGEGKSADVVVKSYTVDTFTFSTGSQISLNLDQENFASGQGNITGSTYASATLTANNKTNTATEHYYLYLNIENNTFTYSINENTPEIIMTITDNAGTEVTDITGLTHTSVTDANGTQVSGYDITNKNGLITLFNNREITTTSSKEERWNIKVTFVNYDASQNANAGKSMSAKVMIQKEKITVANICNSGQTLSSCIMSMNDIDDALYYHNGTITSEDGTVIDANDNSYRYAGASENVNNFVCFGATQSPCPTDNLYRIIGVFGNNVKLIKYDYATSALLGTDGDYYGTGTPDASFYKGSLETVDKYYWNYKANNSASNTWSTSLFNKTNLNKNYLNNIGTTWSNLIEDTTWKVSGHTTYNVTPSAMYTAEITSASKTYGPSDGTSKIGLIYASDYGFAAEPSAWTINLSSYSGSSIISVNWMYMGFHEWLMTPISSWDAAFVLSYNGRVGNLTMTQGYGIRPVLYLKSSVAYAGGSGTKDSPITLVV